MRFALPALLIGLAACNPVATDAPGGVSVPVLADAAPDPGSAPAVRAGIRLIDGDTFEIAGETIRIANIDTPELPPRSRCVAEAMLARAAKAELGAVLNEDLGVLPPTLERQGKDRYGRTLALVRLQDGSDVGEALIERGYAQPWAGRRADWCGVAQ